ncbi:Ninja-family protein AFP3 [Hibiscus syriacus]|uniref:Ninja-family protein n=1 Tax=Hibiscus syriacus TaxID=106335 RepID=A0A6A3AS91_HIBSY|nr:ninja-family protein AFP3-like [Hibiscus syriacus]KAE8706247.1 Ninja-family protein AFP3 [Hibiscus syriacus]
METKAGEIGKKRAMQMVNLPRYENGEEEIELSLGLSMNGRFGVDPRSKKLSRSSSIPDFINNSTDEPSSPSLFLMAACGGSLSRTCSLPVETAEEWRRRKELQSSSRLEAKRKRCEKQKNLRALKDRKMEGFVVEEEEDKREEGSIGSHGSGSSGLCELESQPPQGTYKCPGSGSPTSAQSAMQTEQKPNIIPGKITTQKSENLAGIAAKNQHNQPAVDKKSVEPTIRNIMEDMPCVSTTGDGPNGKRIEGFLYRYRKGDEVRIVCVCHGSFLSPAEFVKHAGGDDVEHPLKHIVVSPSSKY